MPLLRRKLDDFPMSKIPTKWGGKLPGLIILVLSTYWMNKVIVLYLSIFISFIYKKVNFLFFHSVSAASFIQYVHGNEKSHQKGIVSLRRKDGPWSFLITKNTA